MLPATRHKWTRPALIPASISWYSIYLPRRDGRLCWPPHRILRLWLRRPIKRKDFCAISDRPNFPTWSRISQERNKISSNGKRRRKFRSLPYYAYLLNLVNFGLQTARIGQDFRPTNERPSRWALPRFVVNVYKCFCLKSHRRRSSVNFRRGQDIFVRKICMQN